jgi:hypothetical protein
MLQEFDLERERSRRQAEVRRIDCDHRGSSDMGADKFRDGGDCRAIDRLVIAHVTGSPLCRLTIVSVFS